MNFVKKLLLPIAKRYWAMQLLKPEYKKVLKFIYNDESQERLHSDIVMRVHTIEKGLSLKEVRPRFGIPKVITILKLTEKYFRLYKDPKLATFVLSIISEYIDFNRKSDLVNEEVQSRYDALKSKIKVEEYADNEVLYGGTVHLIKEDVLKATHGEFPEFSAARHSIRSFTGEPVSIDVIRNALALAESTPSACNRQPWNIWVSTRKDEILKILELQSGARQFKDDVACVILVSARVTAFTSTEYHQAYVNGGMYAMNLLYALHYEGLGAVPLNMGISEQKLKEIYKFCGFEESNLPIMLIAAGDMEKELNVARSCRFPYKEYVTIHQ